MDGIRQFLLILCDVICVRELLYDYFWTCLWYFVLLKALLWCKMVLCHDLLAFLSHLVSFLSAQHQHLTFKIDSPCSPHHTRT